MLRAKLAEASEYAVDWRTAKLSGDVEIARLQASDAACGEIHTICADAGIEPGNVVVRVKAVAERLDAAEAKLTRLLKCANTWQNEESWNESRDAVYHAAGARLRSILEGK